jgi:hypothetical protein
MLTDAEAWAQADPDDLWVYDKLILSRKLGYTCGPPDLPVPYAGEYIVKPITNMLGMSIGARRRWLTRDTFFLEPGTFWCEVFEGRHLTYDFIDGKQAVCYEGFLAPGSLSRFLKWQRVDCQANVPDFVINLSKKYHHINIECKDDKIIEIHLRPNPDWIQYNADVMIPDWGNTPYPGPEFQYKIDRDSERQGFWIK